MTTGLDVTARLADIRKLLEQHAGLTPAQNNEAYGWKRDCEFLLSLVNHDEIERLIAGIKKAIEACEGCGGKGFDVEDDGEGCIDKVPCQFCYDLRELIGDHTDYPLEAAAAEAPKVGPKGTCQKDEDCLLGDGHGGECDSVPF